MEVILITPNPKYQTLIPSTKIIESTNVDIVNLIQTQVFLNHHYNISFFCIKNNFPYQFHCPLKISKQLLDRNEGAVELYISNGLYFKIESDTDTLEILSNVQNSLQGVESQQNVVFTLHFWEIQIKLYILNQVLQEKRIKEAIATIQSTPHPNKETVSGTTNANAYKHKNTIQELTKIILFIDDNNYEEFLNWSENVPQHSDYILNQKLSKQYMSLKQEIDNQKNSFRNKIKMVQAILGQNINIDKLLNQDKEENQEYKRLRETFQTIKNIDNVLIQQQRKLEQRGNQFKEKREEKHRVHYQNAKMHAARKKEIAVLEREIGLLKYKVDCVSRERNQYLSKRSFQVNNVEVRNILNEEVEKCKAIIKNMNNKPRNQQKQHEHQNILSKSKIAQSIHKSSKKQAENYQNLLKKRVDQTNKQREQVNCVRNRQKIAEEMKKYEFVLREICRFYEKNEEIVAEISARQSSSHHHTQSNSFVSAFPAISASMHNSPKSPKSTPTHTHTRTISTKQPSLSSTFKKPLWPKQHFIVLNQLLQAKSQYQSYISETKQNSLLNPKVSSNSSINQKFMPEEDNRASRVSQIERSSFYKHSMNKITQHKLGTGKNMKMNKNTNVKVLGKSKLPTKFAQNKNNSIVKN